MILTVTTGGGTADTFIAAEPAFREALGFHPSHGTLNLIGTDGIPDLNHRIPWEDNNHCDVVLYKPCYLRVSSLP